MRAAGESTLLTLTDCSSTQQTRYATTDRDEEARCEQSSSSPNKTASREGVCHHVARCIYNHVVMSSLCLVISLLASSPEADGVYTLHQVIDIAEPHTELVSVTLTEIRTISFFCCTVLVPAGANVGLRGVTASFASIDCTSGLLERLGVGAKRSCSILGRPRPRPNLGPEGTRSSGTAPSLRGVPELSRLEATRLAVGVRNPSEGCGFRDGVRGTKGTSRSDHC